jgi:PII-like signaling protein
MQGISLNFYVHEQRNHQHILIYEWLLEQAKTLGIQGGSAFKAIAGFGRHGVLHEDHFFELAGDLPVEVKFIVSEDQAEKLLALVRNENLTLFYVKIPVEYGILGIKTGSAVN